jgi:CHAD domain
MMARARRVPGIRPKQALRINAQRVIAVRLEEMMSWSGALQDASRVQDLHNMRIAAKRLRYVLEMTGVCFQGAKSVLHDLTDIQDDLGELHDLDVLIDILRSRLVGLDSATEAAAVEILGSEAPARDKANHLRRILYEQARNRRRLGLIGLTADKVVVRDRHYLAFQRRWGGAALKELALRIRQVTGLEPADLDTEEKHGSAESDQTLVR